MAGGDVEKAIAMVFEQADQPGLIDIGSLQEDKPEWYHIVWP